MNGGREEERRKCCKIVFIANDCSLSRLERDCSNVFVDNLRMSTGQESVKVKLLCDQGILGARKIFNSESFI